MKIVKTVRRGSVLMEFIVVFPIYLVLFGGVMMLGDMALHAINLTSKERTDCLAAQHVATAAAVDHYADMRIACPFAVSTGVRVSENYSLPQWMRGQLAYAHGFFNRALGTRDTIDDGRLYQPGGTEIMFTKPLNPGEMAFLTLHRCRYATSAGTFDWRTNARPTSDLCTMSDVGQPVWQAIEFEGCITANERLNWPNRSSQPSSRPSRNTGDYARRLRQFGDIR